MALDVCYRNIAASGGGAMAEQDPVLTVPEVAARLRVTPETVRRWLRDGELRGVRFSDRGGWRVLSSEVERKLRGERAPKTRAA
jgi:excisionase family DNA binding protein